jgi:hypothetical protein
VNEGYTTTRNPSIIFSSGAEIWTWDLRGGYSFAAERSPGELRLMSGVRTTFKLLIINYLSISIEEFVKIFPQFF